MVFSSPGYRPLAPGPAVDGDTITRGAAFRVPIRRVRIEPITLDVPYVRLEPLSIAHLNGDAAFDAWMATIPDLDAERARKS